MSAPIPPDPYRIKRILNKLETIWSADPDSSFTDALWLAGISPLEEFNDDALLEKHLDFWLNQDKMKGWKS